MVGGELSCLMVYVPDGQFGSHKMAGRTQRAPMRPHAPWVSILTACLVFTFSGVQRKRRSNYDQNDYCSIGRQKRPTIKYDDCSTSHRT